MGKWAWKCIRPDLDLYLLVSNKVFFQQEKSSINYLRGGGGFLLLKGSPSKIITKHVRRFINIQANVRCVW